MARPMSPFEASPSPAPQPLTKRDVRRNRIIEKLQSMISSFSSNQQAHYRAQLQAIQVDMTLISRADPYDGLALDDTGDELHDKVKALIGGEEAAKAIGAGDEAVQQGFWALAGKRYADFAREVNNAIEQRDADLTVLYNSYRSSITELDRVTEQKLHQAREEHRHLSATIRSRLITTLNKKRNQLLKDKENLDIADANALLMHPRHFSLNTESTAPGMGSPALGALRQDRKTRHLRHRAGSPAPGEIGENGKRKRKAAAMEDPDGNESPAPGFRLPPPDNLGGGRSPFRDAREKQVHAQYEAPAYSLERIFTEKELALATDQARRATWRHFHQPGGPQSAQQDASTAMTAAAPANGSAEALVDGAENNTGAEAQAEGEESAAQPTIENGAAVNGTPPPAQPVAALEMERSTSHQVLTRGGARANPLAALSDLANAAAMAAPGRSEMPAAITAIAPFAPRAPDYHAVTRTEKSGAPAPPAVSAPDADADWALINRTDNSAPASGAVTGVASDSEDVDMEAVVDLSSESPRAMRRRLLDQALSTPQGVSQPFRLPLTDTGPAMIYRKGVDRLPGTGFAPLDIYHEQRARMQASVGGSLSNVLREVGKGVGGEAMSRTTSAGGVSEFGAGVGGRRARQFE